MYEIMRREDGKFVSRWEKHAWQNVNKKIKNGTKMYKNVVVVMISLNIELLKSINLCLGKFGAF